jgi:hypothetical protein
MQTRECYIRRADRTEKMTMREIQDLTLQRDRGIAALDAKFAARRDRWMSTLGEHVRRVKAGRAVGVRLTLLPTTVDVWIESVFRNSNLTPVRGNYEVKVGEATRRLQVPGWGWSDRPIFRGVRFWSGEEENFLLTWDIGTDGLVEASLFYSGAHVPPTEGGKIFREWLLGLVIDGLVTVERVRGVAGAPDVEYGMEFELQGLGVNPVLAPWEGNVFPTAARQFEPMPLVLPRMSVRRSDTFAAIVRSVLRDLLNASGMDLGSDMVVLPATLESK